MTRTPADAHPRCGRVENDAEMPASEDAQEDPLPFAEKGDPVRIG